MPSIFQFFKRSQINGTPFTTPRVRNQRTYVNNINSVLPSIKIFTPWSWFYRIRPSVSHNGFTSPPQNPDVTTDWFDLSQNIDIFLARVRFLSTKPKSAHHANPSIMAPLRATIRHQGRFRWRYQDDSGNWWCCLPRRTCLSYLPCQCIYGEEGFCEQRWRHVNYSATRTTGRSDRTGKVCYHGRITYRTLSSSHHARLFVVPGEIAVVQAGLKFKVNPVGWPLIDCTE